MLFSAKEETKDLILVHKYEITILIEIFLDILKEIEQEKELSINWKCDNNYT
jgi:hypothetical protein